MCINQGMRDRNRYSGDKTIGTRTERMGVGLSITVALEATAGCGQWLSGQRWCLCSVDDAALFLPFQVHDSLLTTKTSSSVTLTATHPLLSSLSL